MLTVGTALLRHKLGKVRGSFLAAGPEFHALVKDWHARMVGALAKVAAVTRKGVGAAVILASGSHLDGVAGLLGSRRFDCKNHIFQGRSHGGLYNG